MLLVLGTIVVDVVRDESDAGTGTGAYVVTRSRDNPTILSPDYVEVLSLTLDPGLYQVWGKLGLANRDSQLPFTAECVLVPSDSDGTPRGTERAGEHGSDYGDLHLGPYDAPGHTGTISLAISQVLDKPGSVVLACRGYGNEAGAFGHYGSIRAIRVGSIDELETLP